MDGGTMISIFVLQKMIDGHYSAEAYFDRFSEAEKVLDALKSDTPTSSFRVTQQIVWTSAADYIEKDGGYTAKYLRVTTDPEYAEHKRLEAKFKEMWK
jgi:hypothetical protein